MTTAAEMRDALLDDYPYARDAEEYALLSARLDALIAQVEAETRAGLVEALVATDPLPEDAPVEDTRQRLYSSGWYERGAAIRAALPAPEPSSGAAPAGRCGFRALGARCVLRPEHGDLDHLVKLSSGAAPVEERCGCGEAWMSAVHDPLYDPEVEGFHAPFPAPRSAGAGDGRTDR